METTNDRGSVKGRGIGFYAAIVAGLAIVGAAAILATNGLPGLQNTPTAAVDGRSVIGKTAN
jgi:hypothetical protein